MSTILKNLKVGRPVLQARLAGKNRLILLVDSQNSCAVRVIDTETQKPVDGFKIDLPPAHPFDFLATDDAVFVYNYPEKKVDTYLLETHLKTHSCDLSPYHANVTAFAIADNGYYFAVGDDKGTCTVWNPKIARPKSIIKGLDGPVVNLTFEEGNNYLAVATQSGKITVVDVGDPTNQAVLDAHRAPVSKMVFNGNHFLSGDRKGKLAVWQTDDLGLVKQYDLGGGSIADIQRCFDGRGALLASAEGRLMLADLVDLEHEPLLLDVLGEPLSGATFNETTKQMVLSTVSGNLLFYDLMQDKEVEHFFAPKTKAPKLADRQKKTLFKAITVDDSVTMRRVIAAAIRNDFPNVAVLEAGNGKEALKLLEAHPDTDVMFLDWNMPTMSGEEVVEQIRAVGSYVGLRIIMATTEGGRDKVTRMLRMGVAGYLVKPFRKESITKIMEKLIERINSGA